MHLTADRYMGRQRRQEFKVRVIIPTFYYTKYTEFVKLFEALKNRPIRRFFRLYVDSRFVSIRLDKALSRRHIGAHEHVEYFICILSVFDIYLF